jgi:hypothetical protein
MQRSSLGVDSDLTMWIPTPSYWLKRIFDLFLRFFPHTSCIGAPIGTRSRWRTNKPSPTWLFVSRLYSTKYLSQRSNDRNAEYRPSHCPLVSILLTLGRLCLMGPVRPITTSCVIAPTDFFSASVNLFWVMLVLCEKLAAFTGLFGRGVFVNEYICPYFESQRTRETVQRVLIGLFP